MGWLNTKACTEKSGSADTRADGRADGRTDVPGADAAGPRLPRPSAPGAGGGTAFGADTSLRAAEGGGKGRGRGGEGPAAGFDVVAKTSAPGAARPPPGPGRGAAARRVPAGPERGSGARFSFASSGRCSPASAAARPRPRPALPVRRGPRRSCPSPSPSPLPFPPSRCRSSPAFLVVKLYRRWGRPAQR